MILGSGKVYDWMKTPHEVILASDAERTRKKQLFEEAWPARIIATHAGIRLYGNGVSVWV